MKKKKKTQILNKHGERETCKNFSDTLGKSNFYLDFPSGTSGKELPMQETKRGRFDSWVRKIPWRRKWQSTPAFLPGGSHGQRSLVGYSPWGHKESDRTEVTKDAKLSFYLVPVWL